MTQYSVNFNPMTTTGFSGAFLLSTDGFVQGSMLDDPAIRYQLEGAIVGASQTPPLWGGLAVELTLPATVNANLQGSTAVASTSASTIHAFTVTNQASAGIITPSSNVPLYVAGTSCNVVRAGSGARICVAVENTTVLGNLTSASATVALYWDPTNLCITNVSSSNYALPSTVQIEALSNTSKTVSYSSGTGFATWLTAGPAAIIRI
jgi:hypothetical protein